MNWTEDATADENSEQLEFQMGRRAPYTQCADWVLMADISPQARQLYWAMMAHVSTSRDDTVVWPTQDMLAEIVGYAISEKTAESDGRKIRKALDELVAIDAVTRKERKYLVGGLRRKRFVYVVHQEPPADYAGFKSLTEFYAARKARMKAHQKAQAAAEAAAAAAAAGNAQVTPEGPNGPLGAELPESGAPEGPEGAQMSPLVGAQMSPLVGGPNEPPNKTNNNPDEEERDERGGAIRRPPAPPAGLTAGQFENVVTDQLTLVSNQQTARAETCAGPVAVENEDSSADSARRAVVAEVRAKYPSAVRSRVAHRDTETPAFGPTTAVDVAGVDIPAAG
ncbi:hypothetical protein [Nocardia nova]